ncbi:hypothetical protein D3C71_2103030 [compost metagenome]
MIFTTNHVRDFHIPVIHYYAEIISRRTISTTDDQIVQLLIAKFDRATDLIVEDH